MLYTDYYSETTVTASTATGLGKNVSTTGVVAIPINPWQGMAGIALVWGAIAGVINYRRYKQGMLSKRDAIAVTASESVGMGISAGIGLFADAALTAAFATAALPAAVPFVMGVTITATSKILWDCATRHKMFWCEPRVLSGKSSKQKLILSLS